MKTPPPASVVSKTSHLIQAFAWDDLNKGYREAWFATIDSLKGAGVGRNSRGADQTEYPDPTGDTLATSEARRQSLRRASDKLDKAFSLIRDAKGLIDYAGGSGSSGLKDGQTQSWTKKEMDAINGVMPSRKQVRAG